MPFLCPGEICLWKIGQGRVEKKDGRDRKRHHTVYISAEFYNATRVECTGYREHLKLYGFLNSSQCKNSKFNKL